MTRVLVAIVAVALACSSASSQDEVVSLVTLGDSLGEGVQSADANLRTQPYSYFNRIAQQMGVNFPLPLILSAPTGRVSTTEKRTRLNPNLAARNLAVSGADIHSLLNERFVLPVDTETDLVLMPRTGSQIEIAEQLRSRFYAVWIGNNDVLSAILDWENLNASPMTSVAAFTADYTSMINRLKALNTKVVVGTLPDVSQISFMLGPEDLIRFLGSNFGLPEGHFTSFPAAMLIKLGFDDGSLIQDPNYVLDPQEVATIQGRTSDFNQLIKITAQAAGMAVADIAAHFHTLGQNPPVFHGLPLTFRFQGGMFSLDTVHPSNIAHALAALAFIDAANRHYGMQIPLISQNELDQIAASDPFVDWNGNLRVRGRPLAGLLETLGPFVGLSGDFTDNPGSPRVSPVSAPDKRLGEAFKRQYLLLKGLPASTPWTRQDAIAAVRETFRPF
jgi:hypothetical protein